MQIYHCRKHFKSRGRDCVPTCPFVEGLRFSFRPCVCGPSEVWVGTIGAESPNRANASLDMPSGRFTFGALALAGSASKDRGADVRLIPKMSFTSAMLLNSIKLYQFWQGSFCF